jgi:hypothetical protein
MGETVTEYGAEKEVGDGYFQWALISLEEIVFFAESIPQKRRKQDSWTALSWKWNEILFIAWHDIEPAGAPFLLGLLDLFLRG